MGKEEGISTFAYNVGKELERMIEERNGELNKLNQFLSSQIMTWYLKTKDEKFAAHFKIEKHREGKIKTQ